jgi:predicted nucleic acid-binding protein
MGVRPMGSLTCLTDPSALLVGDTSTLISVIATGSATAILGALPNRLVVAEAVQAELELGLRRGRPDADRLKDFVEAGLVEIVRLDEIAMRHFEELVIGPASTTLDDGEAATIAYAVEHGGIAVVDERKATRICGERFPTLRVSSTVDILSHPQVEHRLGPASLANAVYSALQAGRMRVLAQHVEWVVGIIGADRAILCKSLPRGARPVRNKPPENWGKIAGI